MHTKMPDPKTVLFGTEAAKQRQLMVIGTFSISFHSDIVKDKSFSCIPPALYSPAFDSL